MLEKPTPYSRLLFVFLLVCAAVMSFIMCSDAARASPLKTQVNNGVEHNVRRRPYTSYIQHNPLFTGFLSTETGFLTGTNSETETGRNYKKGSSIIEHQTNPLRLTKGSLGYSQNIQDNIPARRIFTSHYRHAGQDFERQQSDVNYQPLFQKAAQSGNSFYSYPVIVRKSSDKESVSPFHQRSRPSQVWDPKDAQKSNSGEKVARNYSPKVAEEESVSQPSDSSLFSPQSGRYWSTSLPASRGHYSGHKDTNEPVVVGPQSTSGGIHSSKFFSFASQTAPHAPSISNGLDVAVIKSNPSPEKLTSSITDFSQGLHSASSGETPRHKKIQSFLFKDSQSSFSGHETVNTVTGDEPSALPGLLHKQRPSDAQVYSRFSSNFRQQSQREEPTKEAQHLSDNASSLYINANVAKYAQTDSVTKYQHSSGETLAQMSVHPAAGTDNTMENSVASPHADFQHNLSTGSKKSAVSSWVNTTTGGSVHAHKPGQAIKRMYGFSGFKNPTWRAVKEPSNVSSERANFRQHSLDKGKFKIANVYPSLSPKYSFGQRGASTTLAILDRTTTAYPSSSPGTLKIIQTTTTPRPFPSGFKEPRPLLPVSDAGVDSNPKLRQSRIDRKIFGLKGFETRPLEGAKALVSEPEKSAGVQQGFKGFEFRSSQVWQPNSNRIQGWYNKTEPGSSRVSTVSQNEPSSEALKPLFRTTGRTEATTRFTPDKYKKNHKIYTHLGFQPVHKRTGNTTDKTHWKHEEETPTAASASHRISSAYLRSAGDPKVESRLLNRSTSSTVRGKRVKGKVTEDKNLNGSTSLAIHAGQVPIVRLPKRPARVKAVTYADILGSASFVGVRAKTQTPITPADKVYFPNTTTVTSNSTRRGPEVRAEDEGEDFRHVKENGGMKTSALFLDNEGSGSGGFNMSDVFSTDAANRQGLGEDLELDYLQISTENISFKSVKLSQSET